MVRLRLLLLASPAALVLSLPAHATTLSYTGNLRTDATVTSCGTGCTLGSTNSDADYAQFAAVVEDFTLTSTSTVSATTFSYGGGVNGHGTTIADSGFEPYLSLFDAAGDFLSSTYSGTTCPTGAHTNPTLGGCYDVALDAGSLAAGTYQIVLTANGNFSIAENYGYGNLSDGFTDLGGLYPGEDLHYAFDVDISGSTPPPPPVPEPSSITLFALGAAALTGARQRVTRSLRKGAKG